MTLRAISYGGGVQSTALLVLAAEGRIDFPLFLMANVGDDSEHPDTLSYVREVAAPYAADNGIELVLLDRVRRDGRTETLYGQLTQEDSRSIRIPAFVGGAPGNRSCTDLFKIKVIARELKRRGATADDPAVVGVGISLDEIHRINNRRPTPTETVVYPLVGVGEETGFKYRRDDCARIIREAGLPVPGKSSCWFCPFHRLGAWSDLARDRPDLFERAAKLEETLIERRASWGKDPVYLTSRERPLREVVDTGQPLLPIAEDDGGDWSCGSGWCAT